MEKKYHALHNPLYQQRASITDVRQLKLQLTGFEPNLSTSMQTFDNFSTSRANMSPLMKKLSSLLLTPTVRMKTGLNENQDGKIFILLKNRFTEINEDGSKKLEEEVKGMPSFWLTIFQVSH